MHTSLCQRWRSGRDHYRPKGEVINTSHFEVALIAEDTIAKKFVVDHHYSGTYPAARLRFGLYRRATLMGVAVYSVPCNNKAITNIFDVSDPSLGVELGRFVLLDQVKANGETWFLARTFDVLRRMGFAGVLSFSDPLPRVDIDGKRVFGGHVGTIYQAHNAQYLGRATARTLHLLPNGRTFSARAISKIRQMKRGWRYATQQLEDAGAPSFNPQHHDPSEWLRQALARCTRRVRHPGNHRYAWPLHRRAMNQTLVAQPYPKLHITQRSPFTS